MSFRIALLVLAVSGVVLMVVGTYVAYVTVEAMLSVACNPL